MNKLFVTHTHTHTHIYIYMYVYVKISILQRVRKLEIVSKSFGNTLPVLLPAPLSPRQDTKPEYKSTYYRVLVVATISCYTLAGRCCRGFDSVNRTWQGGFPCGTSPLKIRLRNYELFIAFPSIGFKRSISHQLHHNSGLTVWTQNMVFSQCYYLFYCI